MTRGNIGWRMALAIAPALLLLTMLGSRSEAEEPGGLRLSLSPVADRPTEMDVAFTNTGDADVALNLGIMLGNGKKQLPTQVHVVLTDGGGKTHDLQFAQPGVAGRVDDYIVPLRAGSSYSVRLSRAQMLDATTQESARNLPPGEYKALARFEGTGPTATTGDDSIRFLNLWKGKLDSPTITLSIKAEKCAVCGQDMIAVPILIGLPNDAMRAQMEAGRALLGGCIGDPGRAEYASVCPKCRQWKTEAMKYWQPLPKSFGTAAKKT